MELSSHIQGAIVGVKPSFLLQHWPLMMVVVKGPATHATTGLFICQVAVSHARSVSSVMVLARPEQCCLQELLDILISTVVSLAAHFNICRLGQQIK